MPPSGRLRSRRVASVRMPSQPRSRRTSSLFLPTTSAMPTSPVTDVGMQASCSGHWDLLPTHITDFGPDLKFLGPRSSMLCGSDVIAAVEEVIDLIVGSEEALRLTGRFELLPLRLSMRIGDLRSARTPHPGTRARTSL